MKVLLISAYFPPDTGSAANLFYDLGKKLVQKGIEVTVLTSFPSYHVVGDTKGYKSRKILKEQIENMSVIRVKVPQFPRYIPAMRALWHFAMAYYFSITARRIERHDIALVYSPPLPLGFVGISLTKNGTPFIFNVQDLFPQSAIDLKILKNRFLIHFFKYLEKKICDYAKHITVHSTGNKDYIVTIGIDGKKTTVVPNWIDTDYLQPGKKYNVFSQKYNLQDKFVVSFAGVIGYSQDIDVILDAANLIREKKDILILIVGDGVEKSRLEKKANEMNLKNILFIPMQSRDVYSQVLHCSDICLSALKKEVLTPVVPSKMLSIMAAGKPLIACMNLKGDASKIVEQAQCGFVFPAGDHKELAMAILKLYTAPELREQYGKNGRCYCVENFSLNVCADKYIQLFKQILN
ncbi:MAG: glycosyltransferase family 4 protein [Sedimentisphaerales bacterium]|jgi:glycosyltransferase involved in cell wall biosynthesis